MKSKANPLLIGSFVVFGLALLAIALISIAGNKLFSRKERAVLFFGGSVYGLQVGAPVVFRGVQVGDVESIKVLYDNRSGAFSIPVVVQLDGDAVSGLDGHEADTDRALALPALVQRGLSAQLSMQSLLTGLLYVDLDLRPNNRASTAQAPYRGLLQIPTTATAIQALKNQLDGMDFRRLAEDISAIAASGRALLSGPQLKQALSDLSAITANIKHLSGRLDRRVDPLADELQRSLVAARATLARVGQAADGVGTASDHAATLLAPDSALVLNLQQAADELGRTAQSLRQATGSDSTLVRHGNDTLTDLSAAARALRDLADTLSQQPESVLRGRKAVAP